MAAIGNVETVYLLSTDTDGNKSETNISKGFTVNPEATFRDVDTAMRAVGGLITNTYQDTELITRVSVNEALDEEEG